MRNVAGEICGYTYETAAVATATVSLQELEDLKTTVGFTSDERYLRLAGGTAFMTVPRCSVYSSSKRALLGFSLTARAELENDSIVVSEIYPFITATNFGKNRVGNPASGGPSSKYAEGDKPEFVAGLVLQAIEEGNAQYFANDRLRKMAGAGPRNHVKRKEDAFDSRRQGYPAFIEDSLAIR